MPIRSFLVAPITASAQNGPAATACEASAGAAGHRIRELRVKLVFALFIAVGVAAASSPVLAASVWETCNNAQDVKNDLWDKRIVACEKVIRREKDPERLSVAHFYIAENLGHSYYAFRKTGKTDPCNFDKQNFSYRDDQIMQSGICYGPELAPTRQGFDYTLSYHVQRIADPTTTDYDAVLAEYDKALSYSPGNEKIKKARADFVRIIQDRNDAIIASLNNAGRDEFRDQLARDEFNAVAKEAEGQFREGEFKKAKADLDRLIADPLFAGQQATFRQNAHLMRGVSRLQLNDPSGALADLTKSIEINPEWNAYSQRGLAYAVLGETGNAITDFTQALSMAPDNPATQSELLLQRANQHYAMNATAKALDDLNAAIAKKEAAIFYGARGEIYFHKKDYKKARADFDKAVALETSDDSARMVRFLNLRAAAAAYLGDTQTAIFDYSKIIASPSISTSDRLDAHLSLAIIYHTLRDTSAAMYEYDAVFPRLNEASAPTRAKALAIIDGLKRAGLYDGSGEQYDPALRGALAQCVADPACRF